MLSSLRNGSDLKRVIQKIATTSIENGKPVGVCYGEVRSIEPLEIKLNQSITLDKSQLVLCKTISDYEVEVEENGFKEKVKVLNALKKGEIVVMLQAQGGQKYLVIDRVGV